MIRLTSSSLKITFTEVHPSLLLTTYCKKKNNQKQHKKKKDRKINVNTSSDPGVAVKKVCPRQLYRQSLTEEQSYHKQKH